MRFLRKYSTKKTKTRNYSNVCHCTPCCNFTVNFGFVAAHEDRNTVKLQSRFSPIRLWPKWKTFVLNGSCSLVVPRPYSDRPAQIRLHTEQTVDWLPTGMRFNRVTHMGYLVKLFYCLAAFDVRHIVIITLSIHVITLHIFLIISSKHFCNFQAIISRVFTTRTKSRSCKTEVKCCRQ